jgi:hypothetical protein
LYITFRTGLQRSTVTLANGAPVGTTSGAPTVIAPGLYNLFLDDSAAVEGPEFGLHLHLAQQRAAERRLHVRHLVLRRVGELRRGGWRDVDRFRIEDGKTFD